MEGVPGALGPKPLEERRGDHIGHAQLRLQDGQWSIEDLRTRNGTWVNGQRIHSRTPLSHNDEIRVPNFMAVFENV